MFTRLLPRMTERATRDDALDIHAGLIERRGGPAETRDPGLLDAAVNRPLTGYCRDAIEEAAALWKSLVQNHPFADGNKRAGFACASRRLRPNGLVLPKKAIDQVKGVVPGLFKAGGFNREELDAWLRGHVVERDRGPER